MSEQKKTLWFVIFSGLTLLLAVATFYMTQPAQSSEFEMVGTEFFADFEGGSQAASLVVSAIDEDSATLKQFRVEENDGVWTIPSHYGYPAEASDRLATTSSSLIGLTRESLVGRSKSDFERFGVVDPLGDDILDPETTGKRITLKNDDGDVLVDLIIGKEAEELESSSSQIPLTQEAEVVNFYVRHPDETQTYKVGMNLELSTKFADWIRPDLLNLEGEELRRIAVDNYELEEQADPLGRLTRLFKKQGDQMSFNRDTGFGPWSMDGLDDTLQDLDSGKIDAAVSTLDDLKIVGVRKKTSYNGEQLLNADLTLNQIEELKQNIPLFQQIMGQLQDELSEYGFNLTPIPDKQDELMIVSNAGEMTAGTGQGVVYTLQFGNPISGDENEIEIGSAKSEAGDGDEGDETETAEEGTEADAAADEAVAGDDADEDVRNRFLMIRVGFDETLIGEKPVEPVEPEEPVKPEGYVPAKSEDEAEDAAADTADEDKAPSPDSDEAESADEETEKEGEDSEEPAEPVDDRPDAFKDYDLDMTAYKQQKTEYELKLSEYEDTKKEFDMKVEEGQKLVAELNERFGAWFYVISADNLDSLQLKKEELVTDKEPIEAKDSPGAAGGLPARPNINLDDVLKASGANTPTNVEQDGPSSDENKPATEANAPADEAPSAERNSTEEGANPGGDVEGDASIGNQR